MALLATESRRLRLKPPEASLGEHIGRYIGVIEALVGVHRSGNQNDLNRLPVLFCGQCPYVIVAKRHYK
jgi:hypothetical protein